CTGKFTKKLTNFQGLDKEYTGTFKLGASTPSYDSETEVDHSYPTEHITPAMLEEARLQFVGTIEQVPPMFSAIKVDGQPLYKRARKGEVIEVKARTVHMHELDFSRVEIPEVDFRLLCSKGTYVRSMAHDIGKTLNSGAHLTALRRTKVGDFDIEDAWNLEELIQQLQERIEKMEIGNE
ncbi:MAG: tRNA pseudouridine(55) synthase TruB, partial [Bacteroidota bacterium]